MNLVLDTHAVIWYLLDDLQLPPSIGQLIDQAAETGDSIFISAISLVEIVYLTERGRIAQESYDRLARELNDDASAFILVAVDAEVVKEMRNVRRSVVPDMPDRIIAANALHLRSPLVTRDRRLQSLGMQTLW
jgi:PIN domain nuclease of toxin-antitoxin system